MNNPFEQFGFFLEITKDGSPTLRLAKDIAGGESMHHSAGAAAETVYIYKNVIKAALQSSLSLPPVRPFRAVVVGLGLGYIEISWAQTLLELGQKPSSELSLDTFEIVEGLRDYFNKWLEGRENIEIYDIISAKLSPIHSPKQIQEILNFALVNQSHVHGDILGYKEAQKWNVICYDAFSQKTSGPLWEEAFLNNFIKQHAAEDCAITTYACTGVLKKVLVDNGFLFIKRPGFSGKRDSTLALRGLFKDGTTFQTFSYNQ